MPARKPKCPEGRLYSGLIRSKSNDVGRLQGFPNVPVLFLMAGKSNVHAYSAHWNKMATFDFGRVTIKSCETVLFFVYIWIFSWEATNRSFIQRLTDR